MIRRLEPLVPPRALHLLSFRIFESAGFPSRMEAFLSSPEALAGRPARQASAASHPVLGWSERAGHAARRSVRASPHHIIYP